MSGCRDIWLVRHGRTPSNAARIIQGQIDEPLDELGVAQAEALGRWFSAEGVTFGAAFSSPLQRAARTADLAVAALDVDVERVEGLMERSFGRLFRNHHSLSHHGERSCWLSFGQELWLRR